jgi:predicted phage terminase large subunit-like protein
MGTWTGHGVDIAIVDDPFKNRLEAESATYRNRVWDQFNDAICTRIEPGGSLIVNMTRWHPDDLVGRLLGEEPDKWELMRAPAINDLGAALWPERWPLHLLQARRERVGEYTWASLYQGQPRPRGGALFGEPHTYSQLPTGFSFIAEAMGLDFAYSKKTASDWSALAHFGIVDGKVYVLDVIRRQLKSPEFKALVHATWETRGKPDLRWYGYGPELGIADFMRQDPYSVPLQIKQAPGDHFIRAQPFAAAWNAGEVLVPEDAPWLDDYLAELCSFTGVNDDHDDQVDASGAAFDQLSHLRDHFLPKQFAHGSPEWAAMEQAEMELAALAQMEQDREDKSQWEDWAR